VYLFFRETQDPSLLQRATESVHEAFSYGADFEASSLFIATWKDVGYHNQGADKVFLWYNSFKPIPNKGG
jgi:hypothetical protein